MEHTYYCMDFNSCAGIYFLLFALLWFFFNPVLCLLCIMFWVSVLSECSEVNDSLSINRKADRVYC